MLVELAACNAAFKVIQQCLNDGKEIYDCAEAAANYFNNKSVISKKAGVGGKSDLQAFMALEKLREQEEWLKESMIYAGRPNMYGDWLNFQSKCKREREAAEKLRLNKRAALWSQIKGALLWGLFGILVIPLTILLLLKLLKVI